MLTERAPHLLNCVGESLSFLDGRFIGIDIDAVTQATFIMALKKASQSLGKVILVEHLTKYLELANIAQKNGIPADKALEFSKGAWNNDDVYLNSPEMPGARILLETLDQLKIPYIFISSRPVEFEDVTRKWFKNTFPLVPSKNIILGRKEGVHGGDFKAQMAQKFGVGLHIEDAMEEAVIIADKAKIPVLVVPQPWNAEAIENDRIKLLGVYSPYAGTWPVLRFLAKKEAKAFFSSVAQS